MTRCTLLATPGVRHNALAAVMALALAGPVLAAEVEGRILGPASVTPITGAVIIFHHLGSGVSRTSEQRRCH